MFSLFILIKSTLMTPYSCLNWSTINGHEHWTHMHESVLFVEKSHYCHVNFVMSHTCHTCHSINGFLAFIIVIIPIFVNTPQGGARLFSNGIQLRWYTYDKGGWGEGTRLGMYIPPNYWWPKSNWTSSWTLMENSCYSAIPNKRVHRTFWVLHKNLLLI